MREIKLGDFNDIALRSAFINQTDMWEVYWEADEVGLPCPVDFGNMADCHFRDIVTDPPHIHVLEGGQRRCGWQCAYGRWYLIQVKVNAGVESCWNIKFLRNDKTRQSMDMLDELHVGEANLLYVDLHEVDKEKAEYFINKLCWRVIMTARLVDEEACFHRVIYVDSLNAFDFIRYNEKTTANEIQYLKRVEWLFVILDKEIMVDHGGLIYKLVDERCRFGKKTVLVNFQNDNSYGLLSNRKKGRSIVLNDKDLVKLEG